MIFLKKYIEAAKYRSNSYFYRRKGWTTTRHIVVFESDDWGSIRMPSVETLDKLINKGVHLIPELGYDRYDTLASSHDLIALMETLDTVRDSQGRPAMITQNCVMANPDFNKIKESDFSEYFYEPFTETLKRTKGCENSFELWKEGKDKQLFQQQFHGREHLNVPLWMRLLKQNNQDVVNSFEEGVFSMSTKYKNQLIHCLSAYNAWNQSDADFYTKSVAEGLTMFSEIFGYNSNSMISPCYLWDDNIEITAKEKGVTILQGNPAQVHSCYNVSQGTRRNQFHYIGEINQLNQIYLTRNCYFEPTANRTQGAMSCMKDIKKAFSLKKPAIISSHRQNYIGSLYSHNRDNNLKELKTLLKMIVTEYPDVEFMSSDELGTIIAS